MNKQSISDIQDLKGKRVLMRVDFNVPHGQGRKHHRRNTYSWRLDVHRSTCTRKARRVILCSHFGRPKGKVNPDMSLAPVAKRLGEMVDTKVTMAKDVVGEDAKACVANMKDGEIVVLENARFRKEEEENDPEFSKQLASLAEIYVNDAFGTAHRAHATPPA